MKLIDTYTNMCFYSLVLHEKDTLPLIFAISTVSIVIMLIFKVLTSLYFTFFVLFKLKDSKEISIKLDDNSKLKQNLAE